MLPTTVLLVLRCRTFLRRLLSLAGYVGGAVAVAYGVVAFSVTADMDAQMAAGWPLVGGLFAMFGTHELRAAIRAVGRTPDPIES